MCFTDADDCDSDGRLLSMIGGLESGGPDITLYSGVEGDVSCACDIVLCSGAAL